MAVHSLSTQRDWALPDINTVRDLRRIDRQPLEQAVPFTSTIDLIQHSASRSPDRAALLFQVNARPESPVLTWTYAKLLEQTIQAANLLRQLGVQHEDAVAILAPNMPSTHIALWAAQLAGCAFPINYLLGAEHISKLLVAGRVKAVVTLGASPELAIRQTVLQAVETSGLNCPVLEIDPDEQEPAENSFQRRVQAADAIDRLSHELRPDDTAAIFHTGGTTGLPKILRQTHANELHTSCMAAPYYRFHEGDVMLNGFPLFHVAGTFVYGLAALAARGTIYIPTMLGMRNRGFIQNAWQLFQLHGVSHLGCVPTTLASLAQSYRESGLNGTCGVHAALTGGSTLPAEIANAFEQLTGIPVRNIFGMTECAGIVAIEPAGAPRTPGSAGLPLPYTQVRAVPLDEAEKTTIDRFCAAGAEGVLCIQGPHVSPGYIDASRNAGTFTQNGWLISGDLGYVDAEGRVYITGRAKDLIIRSGHNLDPQAIEEAFLANPDILDCAAVGQPDEYAGELPVVFVTLKPGAQASAETLLSTARPLIAEPPAVPKAVYILPGMPTTPVGKIFKPQLRRLAIMEKVRTLLRGIGALEHCQVSFPDEHTQCCIVESTLPDRQDELAQALSKLPVTVTLTIKP